jgi:4-hydroxybenzoate polyprenyltransferase
MEVDMKKNVALWIVTLLLSLLFVVMFAVAMVEKWGFGVIAWLVLGAVDAWLLRQFFKKSADTAKPTK